MYYYKCLLDCKQLSYIIPLLLYALLALKPQITKTAPSTRTWSDARFR